MRILITALLLTTLPAMACEKEQAALEVSASVLVSEVLSSVEPAQGETLAQVKVIQREDAIAKGFRWELIKKAAQRVRGDLAALEVCEE